MKKGARMQKHAKTTLRVSKYINILARPFIALIKSISDTSRKQNSCFPGKGSQNPSSRAFAEPSRSLAARTQSLHGAFARSLRFGVPQLREAFAEGACTFVIAFRSFVRGKLRGRCFYLRDAFVGCPIFFATAFATAFVHPFVHPFISLRIFHVWFLHILIGLLKCQCNCWIAEIREECGTYRVTSLFAQCSAHV